MPGDCRASARTFMEDSVHQLLPELKNHPELKRQLISEGRLRRHTYGVRSWSELDYGTSH
jgi:hypothetical protein